MLIDLTNLNCSDCPAKHLLNIVRIKQVELMRQQALQRLPEGSANLILLCESAPAEKFVYDVSSDSKLRENLRRELVGEEGDDALSKFMDTRGIWIVDCALCPLNKLSRKKHRRHAATICLERHTVAYLQAMRHAELKAIFPLRCGFLKRRLPSIANRIKKRFDFSNLKGLKENVDRVHGNRSPG